MLININSIFRNSYKKCVMNIDYEYGICFKHKSKFNHVYIMLVNTGAVTKLEINTSPIVYTNNKNILRLEFLKQIQNYLNNNYEILYIK